MPIGFSQCQHRQPSEKFALFYCFVLASAYVASLYLLVPGKVRNLDRDDPTQIKWRTLASLVVCVFSISTYHFIFCSSSPSPGMEANFSIAYLLFQPRYIPNVLVHTIVLFLGPIVSTLISIADNLERSVARQRNKGKTAKKKSYFQEVMNKSVYPNIKAAVNPGRKDLRWKQIRNYVVAPLTEEIVFRGCMVPALLATGMSPLRVSLIAPAFFGIAHFHHAMTRLSKGEKLTPVILITLFQFTYTTLFGCYVSYAFIRTGSVAAVTLSHSYCNWMGLPDLSFMQPNHSMHAHRTKLLGVFVIGALLFKWFFSNDFLLPLPPLLIDAARPSGYL